MNPPAKPAPLDPPAGKPFGVSLFAILAIVATVTLSAFCCAGLVVVGTFTAATAQREQARREAIETNQAVAAALREEAIASKDRRRELSQRSAEINKAVIEATETVERIMLAHDPAHDPAEPGHPSRRESVADLRTWTRGDFTLEAAFVRVDGDNVILRKSDGTEITVPLDELSPEDQCVATMSAPPPPEPIQP